MHKVDEHKECHHGKREDVDIAAGIDVLVRKQPDKSAVIAHVLKQDAHEAPHRLNRVHRLGVQIFVVHPPRLVGAFQLAANIG